jgi:hypothetical protein
MLIPRYVQESKGKFDAKRLSAERNKTGNERMVVVDELLVQLRIEILFLIIKEKFL